MRYILALVAVLAAAPVQAGPLKQNGLPSIVTGVISGTEVPAGFVGEYVSTSPAIQGAALPATTLLVAVATMTLTPGDWEITGQLGITTGGTTAATDIYAAISSNNTSADTRLANNVTNKAGVPSVSQAEVLKVGPRRVNITATTTYYLIGGATYSVLGGAVFNTDTFMQARRVR